MARLKPIYFFIFVLGSLFVMHSCTSPENESTSDLQDQLADKYRSNLNHFSHYQGNPRTIEPNGEIRIVPSGDWTSGFYPGALWYLYETTKDTVFLNAAKNRTAVVAPEQFNNTTHDMGFKVYCSFGNAYRLTGNKEYKKVLLKSAETLITRYNKNVGCIRSWDHHAHLWEYPVIVDNMMNLELLFWAFRETKDSLYYNIANQHALTTLKNHFRDE